MQGHLDVNSIVEDWIERVIAFGGPTVIMEADDMAADASGFQLLPATPTKTSRSPNKRQRQASSADPESTPRPPQSQFRNDQQSRDALSETRTESSGAADGFEASTSTSTSAASQSQSQQSSRSSPRKKEAALRRTPKWPVTRTQLAQVLPADFPPNLQPLALDLKRIADGTEPLVPDLFRQPMEDNAGFLEPPRPGWFYNTATATPDHKSELRAAHSRMQRICRNSLRCRERMDHEPAWNDGVHCRMLEESLEEPEHYKGVGFRNITSCRTLTTFHDNDPVLRENKVDYGIFLQPGPLDDDGLGRLLDDLASEQVDITHCVLSDLAPTPLAISIETKSPQADVIKGSVQLANWVRAHFRQLAKVVERRGHDPASQPLPFLPLLYVQGSTWRADFAYRYGAKTIIYDGIVVGDTQTLYGCYQVRAAIRRLALWVQQDFRAWWLRAATPATLTGHSQPSSSRG